MAFSDQFEPETRFVSFLEGNTDFRDKIRS